MEIERACPSLPYEVWNEIFSRVQIWKDLVSLTKTCKKFRCFLDSIMSQCHDWLDAKRPYLDLGLSVPAYEVIYFTFIRTTPVSKRNMDYRQLRETFENTGVKCCTLFVNNPPTALARISHDVLHKIHEPHAAWRSKLISKCLVYGACSSLMMVLACCVNMLRIREVIIILCNICHFHNDPTKMSGVEIFTCMIKLVNNLLLSRANIRTFEAREILVGTTDPHAMFGTFAKLAEDELVWNIMMERQIFCEEFEEYVPARKWIISDKTRECIRYLRNIIIFTTNL